MILALLNWIASLHLGPGVDNIQKAVHDAVDSALNGGPKPEIHRWANLGIHLKFNDDLYIIIYEIQHIALSCYYQKEIYRTEVWPIGRARAGSEILTKLLALPVREDGYIAAD